MDTVDIIPTTDACRQIARLFRVQQADAEALAARAARALDDLNGRADADLAPWDRALLAAAFAALSEAAGTRVLAMREGLEALGPYADADADDGEGADDAP